MRRHRFHDAPTRRYACMLVYRTPYGTEKTFSCVVDALSEALALPVAERRLTHDRRRSVKAIVHRQAMEQTT
ncbi:MAG: hypothetical protein RLZZ387_2609 [Chloroflexota bacterium]|jgi:hypothetical protein